MVGSGELRRGMRVDVGMRQAKKVRGSGEVAPGECSAQQAKVRPKGLHMKRGWSPDCTIFCLELSRCSHREVWRLG